MGADRAQDRLQGPKTPRHLSEPPHAETHDGAAAAKHRPYVFLNRRNKPWNNNSIRLRIQRLKIKLNLPEDLCAYLLRHAFGTNAILNGVDVATVAELMGHTSLEMVSRVYLHLADQHSHLTTAVEKATRPVVPSMQQPAAARSGV